MSRRPVYLEARHRERSAMRVGGVRVIGLCDHCLRGRHSPPTAPGTGCRLLDCHCICKELAREGVLQGSREAVAARRAHGEARAARAGAA
jgi:hypothetical protein